MALIVSVTKKADDPITPCRVSLGAVLPPPGAPVPPDTVIGYYCVYRGTKEQAIRACETALRALQELPHEPAIAPDRGKNYS
jgi:hypothetical protein